MVQPQLEPPQKILPFTARLNAHISKIPNFAPACSGNNQTITHAAPQINSILSRYTLFCCSAAMSSALRSSSSQSQNVSSINGSAAGCSSAPQMRQFFVESAELLLHTHSRYRQTSPFLPVICAINCTPDSYESSYSITALVCRLQQILHRNPIFRRK